MHATDWVVGPDKYLSNAEARRLLAVARGKTSRLTSRRHSVAVRDYFVIHLALATGLRVMEIAALNCGDLLLRGHASKLLVRHGKGDKKRLVYFGRRFAEHCREYLDWKRRAGEPTEPQSPLLLSSRTKGHMSERAIQKAFKRCARLAGLPEWYSIHSLRHTYACALLKAGGGNIRLVQKQLGHSSITTTQVYADVMTKDIERALEGLYQ